MHHRRRPSLQSFTALKFVTFAVAKAELARQRAQHAQCVSYELRVLLMSSGCCSAARASQPAHLTRTALFFASRPATQRSPPSGAAPLKAQMWRCGVSQQANDVARNLPFVMWLTLGKGADGGTAVQKPPQRQLQNPESGLLTACFPPA